MNLPRVLLITPPMIQWNAPYPATTVLAGFLESLGATVAQEDLSLGLALRLFSPDGLDRLREALQKARKGTLTDSSRFFLDAFQDYRSAIGPAIRFLQGKDPGLAHRIAARAFLPEGPRFVPLAEGPTREAFENAFGELGIHDRAKHLASLFFDDLADAIQSVEPSFSLSRYGEKLAASQASFDPLARALEGKPSFIDEMIEALAREAIDRHRPEVIGLTAPFPGNVYGALRIAKAAKEYAPKAWIVLGGGYVNTELRALKEPRIFAYVDFITLDDGEMPLQRILEHRAGKIGRTALLRTFHRDGKNVVQFTSDGATHDVPQMKTGMPTTKGLPVKDYLSTLELLNPMHRLWSDGFWNKLILAHGCYWKKCAFCDVNLDYIGRYEASPVELTLDRMEKLIAETGSSGFHFVDEAAPPAVLRKLAEGILDRGLAVSWWGNIRFDRSFTPELARKLADSGCIAVSGGLEVASDRLLKLMQKGVSVEQVARVTKAFRSSGILVHAYLMYGFPTETEQETIDSLERVRQLFEEGCLSSAFWHRFSATAHSPIGRDPDAYGIKLLPRPETVFAENDLPFEDPTPCDHEALGVGLRRALYNFLHGIGLDADVREWFDDEVPKAKVPRRLISAALRDSPNP